jgi:hypothetical protein
VLPLFINNSKKENKMRYFDTKKLRIGAKDVESIMDASDSLGLEIIRIVGVKTGASNTGVGGFEIPREIVGSNGIGSQYTLTHGIVYMYPDQKLNKHGFVLDTEKNRRVLASHLAAPVLNILDKKDRTEIVKVAELLGKATERGGVVPAHIPQTAAIKKNEEVVEAKSKKLEESEQALLEERIKTKLLMEQLENAQRTEKIREKSVEAHQEVVDDAQAKLDASQANAQNAATNLEYEDKSLGDDGEIVVENRTAPKKAKVTKRQIVKK